MTLSFVGFMVLVAQAAGLVVMWLTAVLAIAQGFKTLASLDVSPRAFRRWAIGSLVAADVLVIVGVRSFGGAPWTPYAVLFLTLAFLCGFVFGGSAPATKRVADVGGLRGRDLGRRRSREEISA